MVIMWTRNGVFTAQDVCNVCKYTLFTEQDYIGDNAKLVTNENAFGSVYSKN